MHTGPARERWRGMAYQRAHNEDILFGGYTDTAPPAAPTTAWIWSGTGWRN